MPIDISVQICTYNRKNLLIKALDALFKQDYPEDRYEIVLVDDGSTDGTGDAVKALNPPCRINYQYQQNSGLSTGRNRGIRAAEGRVILFIDDDVMASKDLLSQHMSVHENNPRSVVRGVVNHVENLDDIEDREVEFTMQDISTSFFWTSNVSVEKKFLVEAGLFDEDFKEYGWEDLEIGIRLRKLGLKLKYNKKAIGFHYKSKWKKSDLPRIFRQTKAQARTAIIFLEKHPTIRVRLAVGIHTPRILWNSFLYMGGLGEAIAKALVEKPKKEELTGIRLMAARLLASFEYFRTIKEETAKNSVGAAAES